MNLTLRDIEEKSKQQYFIHFSVSLIMKLQYVIIYSVMKKGIDQEIDSL
jgi:hypothetical protein